MTEAIRRGGEQADGTLLLEVLDTRAHLTTEVDPISKTCEPMKACTSISAGSMPSNGSCRAGLFDTLTVTE